MSDLFVPAGRLRRLTATIVDAVLVPALTVLLVMATGVVEDADDYRDNSWMLHVVLLAILSYLLLNGYGLWRTGQTLGKRLLGVAIVAAHPRDRSKAGQMPLPFWKLICIRALFFPLLFVVAVPWLAWIPLLDQGLILARSRRCLHDRLSGSIVVRTGRK